METRIGTQTRLGAAFRVFLALMLAIMLVPISSAYADAESSTPSAEQLGLKVEKPIGTNAEDTQGVIEGIVYVDANENGELDPGEAAVADCMVTYGAPLDKTSVYDQVRTDAYGTFTFTDVADGSYGVRVESQTIASHDYVTTQEESLSDPIEKAVALETPEPEPEALEESEPVVEPEEETLLPEEGEEENLIAEEGTSVITGMVWLDENEDGVRDASEKGISGYTVSLHSEDSEVMTAVTDTEGVYEFTGLVEGNYQVALTGQTIEDTNYLIPLKMLQTGADNKFDLNASDESSQTSITEEIVLASDTTVENIDAGVRNGGQQMAPMAGGTLTINTNTHTVNTTNLQSVLESLYSPTDIAAATTLEFTGSTSLGFGSAPFPCPSMTYLDSLNIDTLDISSFTGTLNPTAFGGTANIKTVAIGSTRTSLPHGAFGYCTGLTTISDTLANAQGVSAGVIDLERTGITSLPDQMVFFGCSSITTVTLGSSIASLPLAAFNLCTSLTTISDTLANAQGVSAGVIDLQRTGVSSFASGGNQFGNCASITTVTLGVTIAAIPAGLFSTCASLTTISDTLANAQLNPGVIDLDKTGVTSLGASAFTNSPSITTVTLGSSIPSIPGTCFGNCESLTTMSDTLANAQGISAGLIDMDRLPVLDPAGYQFQSDHQVILYAGKDPLSLPYSSCNDIASVFVPETNPSITIDSGAFYTSSPKLYVRGPQATSPTTVVNPGNIAPAILKYYYEVSEATDGNGTISRASGGFITGAIETRELAEGNLTSGNSFVEDSEALTYTVTPIPHYGVKKIEATAGGVTTDITASCINNQDGTWTFPGVTDDTDFYVTFEPIAVVYDDTNSTGNTYTDPTLYNSGDIITVLDYSDPALASFTEPSHSVFAHWNTAADDSGTIYEAGDTFSIYGEDTLCDIWSL